MSSSSSEIQPRQLTARNIAITVGVAVVLHFPALIRKVAHQLPRYVHHPHAAVIVRLVEHVVFHDDVV